MDIGDWLRGLGLAQYAPAFREHAIDADVLSELTEGDLQGLGIPLGHRKRLLRAVRALGAAAPAAEPPPPAAPPPAIEAPQLAERRQLTVLFCDLVGSTALATARRRRRHKCGRPGASCAAPFQSCKSP